MKASGSVSFMHHDLGFIDLEQKTPKRVGQVGPLSERRRALRSKAASACLARRSVASMEAAHPVMSKPDGRRAPRKRHCTRRASSVGASAPSLSPTVPDRRSELGVRDCLGY